MQLRKQLAYFRISRLFGQQLIQNGLSPGKLFCFDAACSFRQQIERLGILGQAACRARSWRGDRARTPTGLFEMFDELEGLTISRIDPQDSLIRILCLSMALLCRPLPP
jgi:hypothetical protein